MVNVRVNKPERQSNLELLRIMAMLMILIIHADYGSLSIPTQADFNQNFVSSATRVFFESFGVFGVNIFVAISGWFLIKSSVKRVSKFLFQCLFFSIGIYVVCLAYGFVNFSIEGLEIAVLLRSYWFVLSFLALLILSPIINSFLEISTEKQIRCFLIAFYLFQTIYTKDNAATFINQGYSTFSFIGIYVLSNYARKYISSKLTQANVAILVGICVVLNFGLGLFGPLSGIAMFTSFMMNYCNPLIVIGSVAAVMLFSKINITTNRFINFVSASAFTVYLLHSNSNVFGSFCGNIKEIYMHYSGVSCLCAIFAFIIGIYLIAIIIDQPRKFLWNRIENLWR